MEIIDNQKNINIVKTNIKKIELLSFRRKKIDKIEEYIKKLNPNISNITEDNIDNFETLFNRCFYTMIPKSVGEILLKAMTNIDKISKETVLFLMTLDDRGLDILKNQFKYVSGSGILTYKNNSENIQKDFWDRGLNEPKCSDIIKFTGNIWIVTSRIDSRFSTMNIKVESWEVNENSYYPKSLKVNDEELSEKVYLSDIKTRTKDIEFLKEKKLTLAILRNKAICVMEQKSSFECNFIQRFFRQLTEIGSEMYDILKDEIDPMPDDYIQKVFDYHKEQNPQLNLVLESYDQSRLNTMYI